MVLTGLPLRFLQTNNGFILQSATIRMLVLGLAILTSSILTGCSSSGDAADVSNTPSSGGGGSSSSSNGAGGGGGSAQAGTATASLAWDPVPGVLGYFVHYGTSSAGALGSCSYAQSTFSSSPSATVSGLATNTTYYFAVSAYNGLESSCSAEVSTLTGSV